MIHDLANIAAPLGLDLLVLLITAMIILGIVSLLVGLGVLIFQETRVASLSRRKPVSKKRSRK